LIDWFLFVFNANYSNISAILWRPVLSGGRSPSTRRQPPTMGKQLVNCITCGCVNIPFIIIRNYVFQQQRLMGLTSTLIKGPGLNSFYGSKPPQWCNHVSLCDINPSKTIKWQHFKQSKPYSKLKYCRFIYFILYFVFDFQWR
jgi:hypothetical protein